MPTKLKNTLVSQTMSKLYLNGEFADFTFTFEGQTVPVHKLILATASPVFRAMFFGLIKDKEAVEITDSYADAFKEFLQFFYLDEVTLTMENIVEVAKMADKYDMLDCVNTCVAYLENELTDKNMLWAYKLAITLENEKLKQICETHIKLYTGDVFKSNEFLRCDRKLLKSILEMDALACKETEILDGCLAWAKNACQQNGIDESNAENLRTQLGDCLSVIRFAAMTAEEFTAHTVNHKGMLTGDEIADILYTILVPSFSSIAFSKKQRINLRKWDSSRKTISCHSGSAGSNIVDSQEGSFQFSVNTLVILGLICGNLKCQGLPCSTFEIELLEVCKKTVNESSEKKVLVKQSPQSGQKNIILDPTVIIYPQKLYEIRTRLMNHPSYYTTNSGPWKSEYKLDDETTITFHTAASGSGEQSLSLVNELYFHRI